KPGQVKLPLKPGQLALCELMGADFYQLDSVRKGADPLQVIDYLSVPQRLPRGRVLRESALQQGRSFLDQPSSKHLLDARIDTPAQVLARAGQTQRHNCGLSAGCRGVPIGALLGKRLARLPN